jgi:hypothetical protein
VIKGEKGRKRERDVEDMCPLRDKGGEGEKERERDV